MFGERALPAWQEVLASDTLGPHARRTLSWWEKGPDLQEGDRRWLGVESAAALPGAGPDEALSFLADAARPARKDRPAAAAPSKAATPLWPARRPSDPGIQLLNVMAHRTSLDNHPAAPPGLR